MIGEHQSRSDSVFRAALFLSAAFHLVALMYLKLPELNEPMRGKMTLSVILAKPQEVGQPIPEVIPPPVVEPAKQPPLEEFSLPVQEPVAREKVESELPKEEPLPESIAEPESGETLQAVPADPVTHSTQIVEAGKVRALLQINKQGVVQQIIWNTLPVITEEGLQRMEAQLRLKTYLATGSSYTVSEIVEVPREE